MDDLHQGVLARRLGAWCADLVIVGAVAFAAWLVVALLGVLTFGAALPLLALLAAIPVVYHVLFVAGAGAATPGQRLFDLAVRREDNLGAPGLARAVVFTAGLYFTLGAGAIWFGLALFLPRGRALHDIVAGVIVVRRSALKRREGLLLTPARVAARLGRA